MMVSAVRELPKGSTFLQFGGEVPPYAKKVQPFWVYAGTPRQRGQQADVWRVWENFEDAPLDEPSAADHAYAFLDCLRADRVLAGRLIPASDLERLYSRFCESMNLPKLAWQSVAAEINRRLGGKRLYRRINGRNKRVYPVPKASRAGPRKARDAG